MVEFDSAALYIEGATSLVDKVTRIDAIINALLVTAAEAAGSDNISEYWLDNGQTKIKTVYNGASQVFKSIEAFERLKQLYINKLNGRVIRLVDSKNFRTR